MNRAVWPDFFAAGTKVPVIKNAFSITFTDNDKLQCRKVLNMKREYIKAALPLGITAMLLASSPYAAESVSEAVTEEMTEVSEMLSDGIYTVDFDTDSSMFHVNEACDGKGTLTVRDGEMTVHITLVSKNITNLFPGLAEEAEKEGAELLEPTVDVVTYSDGMTEEVFGFDVPVPVIGEEFDLALIGKKGKWYDHKVSVANPVEAETEALTE